MTCMPNEDDMSAKPVGEKIVWVYCPKCGYSKIKAWAYPYKEEPEDWCASCRQKMTMKESKPPAGEWTKEIRKQLESHKWSLPSRNQMYEACERIDQLESDIKELIGTSKEDYIGKMGKQIEQLQAELKAKDADIIALLEMVDNGTIKDFARGREKMRQALKGNPE